MWYSVNPIEILRTVGNYTSPPTLKLTILLNDHFPKEESVLIQNQLTTSFKSLTQAKLHVFA